MAASGSGRSGYSGPIGVGAVATLAAVSWDSPIAILPNGDVDIYWPAPAALTVTGIRIYYVTAGTTAGAYTIQVEAGAGFATNLLSAATLNIISTANAPPGPVADATLYPLTLTATAADLSLAADTMVRVRVSSDNVDLVAAEGYVQILYAGP